MKKLTALLAAGLFATSVWAQSTTAAESTTTPASTTTSSTKTVSDQVSSTMSSVGSDIRGMGNDISTWTHKATSEMQGEAGLAFESEYVYRGKKWAQSSIQPTAMLALPVWDGTLYAKTFMNFPIDPNNHIYTANTPSGTFTAAQLAADGNNALPSGNPGNELDFTVGYKIELPWMNKMFSVDAGYTYYYYPTGNFYGIDRENEIYIGGMANVILNPTLYAYYDWNLEQFVLEGNISYSFDLGECMSAKGFFVDLGATLGGLWASAYNGDQRFNGTIRGVNVNVPRWKNSYGYLGLMAGLRYMINSVAEISLTINYSGNNDGKGGFAQSYGSGAVTTTMPANVGNHENLCWWGIQTRLQF